MKLINTQIKLYLYFVYLVNIVYFNFKDILEFIEESPHGIILFSLGSIAAFSSTPENVRIAIQEAFMELPQRVIMKYEGEWVNKPDNMMTRKWIPQRDILSMYFIGIILLLIQYSYIRSI